MNWLKNLLAHVKGQDSADKYAQLRLARLREVQKWEVSSPDTIYIWQTQRRCRKNWTFLDIYKPNNSRQMPNWVKRAARRINVRNKGPKFYHKRFVTYKIEYDDHDGLMVFKGIKPSSLVKIELEIRKLRRRGKIA